MRNKALIEVRKREANIRAEIEAQLGVKRAEIRDRLSSLTQQMDDFRTMAEVKMRESIESKVQGEIDADEARLADQQQEFDNLKSQDARAEKRQSWLQAISGQGTQTQQPQMGVDPSALGARPGSLGAAAGRQPRGALAQAAAQHTPSMGLAGMRAPRSAAKALSGAQPIARPVKAPIGGGASMPGQLGNLPQPIQPKVVRQPVTVTPAITPSVVKAPEVIAPAIEPIPEKVVTAPKIELEIPEEPETPVVEVVAPVVEELEPEVETQIEPVIETEVVEPEIESVEEVVAETTEEIVEEVQKIATLTPIKKLEVVKPVEAETTPLKPVEAEETAVLRPVTMKVLTPAKRRGPPPSSAPGQRPGSQVEKEVTASLRPIKKLTPVESPSTDLNTQSDED